MKRVAYTDGPWAILKPIPGEHPNFGIVARGCSSVLAEIFSEFKSDGEFSIAEARANAALVYAAPEMYEALIAIVKEMQMGHYRFLDIAIKDKIADALNKVSAGVET